jgi:hypothetical protein
MLARPSRAGALRAGRRPAALAAAATCRPLLPQPAAPARITSPFKLRLRVSLTVTEAGPRRRPGPDFPPLELDSELKRDMTADGRVGLRAAAARQLPRATGPGRVQVTDSESPRPPGAGILSWLVKTRDQARIMIIESPSEHGLRSHSESRSTGVPEAPGRIVEPEHRPFRPIGAFLSRDGPDPPVTGGSVKVAGNLPVPRRPAWPGRGRPPPSQPRHAGSERGPA